MSVFLGLLLEDHLLFDLILELLFDVLDAILDRHLLLLLV